MKKYGVIFDFDGTLLDNVPALYKAACAVFEYCNVKHPTFEDYYLNCIPPFLPYYNERGVTIPIEQIQQIYYEAENLHPVNLFEDVARTVRYLRDSGVFLGIVSAKPEELFRLHRDRNEIFESFHAVVTDCFNKAPAIRSFCQQYGLPKENVWFVGDGAKDIVDGTFAGVNTIGITRGCGNGHSLKRMGANHVVDHLDQFRALFDKQLGKGEKTAKTDI